MVTKFVSNMVAKFVSNMVAKFVSNMVTKFVSNMVTKFVSNMVVKFFFKSVHLSHEELNQTYHAPFKPVLAFSCAIVPEFQCLFRITKDYNFDFIFKDTVTVGGRQKGRSDDNLVICLTNEVRKTGE
jgi:hypothetical protein